MELDDFLLRPLPNHLFTRDTSAWIYDGVSINAMRRPARRRETVHFEAIYRHHPEFRDGSFHLWSEGQADYPSTIEGGDVLVIGNGAVLIGMSERTTPQAVEMLAHKLFAAGSAETIVALDMPKRRAVSAARQRAPGSPRRPRTGCARAARRSAAPSARSSRRAPRRCR
jgi:arginine deiminase